LFATGVIDTGGKFVAGVVDTSGKLPLVANLPLVLLTPVANLPLVSATLAKLVVANPLGAAGSTALQLHMGAGGNCHQDALRARCIAANC